MKKIDLIIACFLLVGTSLSTMAQIPKDIQKKYDYIQSLESGYHVIYKNELVGLIDAENKEIVEPKYHAITDFQEDRALVNYAGLYGFVDITGKEIIPIQYESATQFSNGLAIVKTRGEYGGIDKNGQIVIPLSYDYAERSVSKSVIKVKRRQKEFFFNEKGEEVLDFASEAFQIEKVQLYTKPANLLIANMRYSLAKRKLKLPQVVTYGLIKAKDEKGKWGVLDNSGKTIIPFSYDELNYKEKKHFFTAKRGEYTKRVNKKNETYNYEWRVWKSSHIIFLGGERIRKEIFETEHNLWSY